MGGRPLAAVITLGVSTGESPRRLRAIYRGLEEIAKKYDVDLVGGETTRSSMLFLNVALLGECRGYPPVLRSGARGGDLLFVTGRLGGTLPRRHLTFTPRLAEGEWLGRKKFATSLMDLSDGLGADLPRLAAASKVVIHLEEDTVPRTRGATVRAALNDGEDYELLFTVRPARVAALKKEWPFAVPLHCIGYVRSRGAAEFVSGHGFDHFK
jgi:thiamine-monophosphate kinase